MRSEEEPARAKARERMGVMGSGSGNDEEPEYIIVGRDGDQGIASSEIGNAR